MVEGIVRRLLTEHSLIHKLQLSRLSDVRPEDLPFRSAPGEGGGDGG